jgi:hypothetical protein
MNGVDVGDYAAPTLIDQDNDGDVDMWVGASDGKLYYVENTGASSCTSCLPGYYGDLRRASSLHGRQAGCKECPTGFKQDKAGQTTCDRCVPGTYMVEVKATKCKVRGWYYLFADLGRPERSTAFVEVGSFKELEKELEELPLNEIETYYLRLGGRAGGNVNQILSTAAYKHCVVIFGGSAQACQSFASSNMYFLRQDPIVIDMPVLSTEELAKISLQRIEDRGYKLSCPGSSRSNTSTSQLKAMIGIVAQKYSNSEIVKRSTALSRELDFQGLEGFGSVCFCCFRGFGFWMALGMDF